MLVENIKVNVDGMEIEVSKDTTLLEISKMFNKKNKKPIIAKLNGDVYELTAMPKNGDDIEFLDVTNSIANRVYANGLIMLINYVFNELYHGKKVITVKHSVDRALCIETSSNITKEELSNVEKKMHALVDANLPITRVTVLKSEAIEYFNKNNDKSRVNLLGYINNTYVHLYKIGSMYDYITNKMPSETSCLDEFKLAYLDDDEFILEFPDVYTGKIRNYVHHEKFFDVFHQEKDWGKLVHIENVSDLNNVVSAGYIDYLIRISETMMNNKILEQVKAIKASGNKIKVVLIAGPSSSGKTTSCSKLAMYLYGFGLTPKMISMDNFFKERVNTPKKPNGEYDFECLEALDLDRKSVV